MKKILAFLFLLLLIFFMVSNIFSYFILEKPNACILYSKKMKYYCIYEESEVTCKKWIGNSYFDEEIIKVWFYPDKYCREFGFKSRF